MGKLLVAEREISVVSDTSDSGRGPTICEFSRELPKH